MTRIAAGGNHPARMSPAYYVLVAGDGAVLGRFNLYDIGENGADLGYRVAQHVAGHGMRPRPSASCAGRR
ncbi:hypothetical protein [Actinoplanes subtropicus]|uniref:hypothetical protein n=1 Tax=Actinoplanes subtropicus TaxID=543632 RepID=UPI001B802265|nr:hypothetical protein [Actinoplanes subtropicus]